MSRFAALLLLLMVTASPADAAAAWRWPVSGPVITPYRNGDDPYAAGQHRGIDIGAPVGAPVVAAAGGRVRFAGVVGSSGLTVSVRTADGTLDTSYLHLSSVTVRKGDAVAAGVRIGAIGASGNRSAAAPHLHFGVRDAGSQHAYRNPLDFLPPPTAAPAPEPPPGAPVPVPAPVRTAPAPAKRHLPAARRVPRPAPRFAPVPRGRPLPAPVRSAPIAPRPLAQPDGTPHAVPARPRPLTPLRSPARLGPAPASASPSPAGGRNPAGAPSSPAGEPVARGPDLGWTLACLGLLLAALCVTARGGDGSTPNARRSTRRLDLAALFRPLRGRG